MSSASVFWIKSDKPDNRRGREFWVPQNFREHERRRNDILHIQVLIRNFWFMSLRLQKEE